MISLEVAIVVSGICLLLEAFFTGTELAMVSADRVALRRRAAEGSAGARQAEWFLQNPQVLLATTLFGTQASLVVSTTVMTIAILERYPSGGELITVALLSPAVLIFGEMVPKTYCQQNADRIVHRLAYPLRVASILFAPFVTLLRETANLAGRALKVQSRSVLVTREELRLLLESSSEKGAEAITEGERAMITNVLEFRDTTVYDVMVPLSEVTALPEDATLDDASTEVAEKQHTRIPIYRERVDQITGVLHAFDLLKSAGHGGRTRAAELARPPIFVPESKPAVDLLVELQRAGQQLAVVVDEYGGAVGICTIEDILEEIVGEIEDEYDKKASSIRPDGPGAFRVLARTPIDEVNRTLHIELPEGDDYESVAGLILERMKRIPERGETLRIGNIVLTVLQATERAVEEVRIQTGRKK